MTEDIFFQTLFARLPSPDPSLVAIGPGDDCAALRQPDGSLLLFASDQVVGDRHYHLSGPDATAPEAAGRKLLARNLSDIAAMGGNPLCCVVSVAFAAGKQDEAWLLRFYQGIIDLGREWNVPMVGGDLAKAPHDAVASLAILGTVPADQVCLRSGARPGELVFATGVFGDSLATGHHLSFTPRCCEGRWLAEQGMARSMIDVSDGLLLDCQRLCQASGVRMVLDTAAVPRRRPETTLRECLVGGEDYELVFSVARDSIGPLCQQWPFETPLTCIGRIEAGEPGIVDPDGRPLPADGVWDHLQDGWDGGR